MINIAILGFGVVGGGVYEVIKQNGLPVTVKHILDKRTFPGHDLENAVTTDFSTIIDDPAVDVVVETMGGASPAYEFSLAALRAGKSVVTSNKMVVEKYGDELKSVAAENNVSYLYEASAGGGIPVIHPIKRCLRANKITRVAGILNGTTNYILRRMTDGIDFAAALKEAQAKGYAEADPTADICGYDTARKIAILATEAFGRLFRYEDCAEITGIDKLTTEQINAAAGMGYRIKLLGVAENNNGRYSLFVAPCLVGEDTLFAATGGVFNAVSVTGNMVGEVVFYGQGAGSLATASAVVSDILETADTPALYGRQSRVAKEELTAPRLEKRNICGVEFYVI